jgi:hypothetical protein
MARPGTLGACPPADQACVPSRKTALAARSRRPQGTARHPLFRNTAVLRRPREDHPTCQQPVTAYAQHGTTHSLPSNGTVHKHTAVLKVMLLPMMPTDTDGRHTTDGSLTSFTTTSPVNKSAKNATTILATCNPNFLLPCAIMRQPGTKGTCSLRAQTGELLSTKEMNSVSKRYANVHDLEKRYCMHVPHMAGSTKHKLAVGARQLSYVYSSSGCVGVPERLGCCRLPSRRGEPTAPPSS